VVRQLLRQALLIKDEEADRTTRERLHPWRAGANHVQAGNIALSVQVMLGWLDSMDRRDSQPGLMS